MDNVIRITSVTRKKKSEAPLKHPKWPPLNQLTARPDGSLSIASRRAVMTDCNR